MGYYADDTSILTKAKHTKTVISMLEKSLKACNKYLNKWKIKVNAEKTQAIVFPFNRSPKRKPSSPLTFQGTEIVFSNSVTYLGLPIDSGLNFKQLIDKFRDKAIKCSNSRLSSKNKNILYKSIIRPVMSNGCPGSKDSH